jgi:hypothetical protein
MCDYSLHLVASRPAKVGDRLVTMKFNNTLRYRGAPFTPNNIDRAALVNTEVQVLCSCAQWSVTAHPF